jgi:ABC-type transport system involved in multi-copper enzyme maturation permease subunit
MVRLIAFHRFKEDILAGKSLVLVLVTVSLLGASTLLTLSDLQRRQEIFTANAGRETELQPLLRRPALLSVLVSGVDADVYSGKSVAGVNVEEVPPQSYENPLLALFPTPDLATIVQYILSLLALMMAFDVVAGVKERKTLALVFSNPVPRASFLLGQCLGSYLSLAVAFLLGFAASCLVLLASGMGALTGDVAVRLAGIALVSLLYLAVFFLLGAMISASTFSSSKAFLGALLTWVVLVLILPHTLMLLGSQWRRVPSSEVFSAQVNAARNDILGKPKAFMTEWPRANEAMERLEADYARQVQGQESLMQAVTRLSPAGSYVFAISALAGTSSEAAEGYLAAVRSYLSRLRHFVYVESQENPKAEKPVFFRPGEDLAGTLGRAARDAGLLALWISALAVAALWRFQRYDLR